MQVVCRGQGLPSNQPSVTTEASPGVYVWIKELNCTGSESSIMDCPYTLGDGTAAGSQDCLQMSITCVDSGGWAVWGDGIGNRVFWLEATCLERCTFCPPD